MTAVSVAFFTTVLAKHEQELPATEAIRFELEMIRWRKGCTEGLQVTTPNKHAVLWRRQVKIEL